MLKWFKKYFIPHEHNDHRPHILRGKATILILGILFFVEAFFLVQVFILFPNIKFFADILESVLIQDTNANRLADNLPDLKINSLLTQAAQAKAEDMASKGYFNHTSPEGITPWYWFGKAGYQYSYAGENLAINFSDSEDVVNAWMNSPGHKANILNNNFTDIGIGVAKGVYQNRETIFIVQMFGRPFDAAQGKPARTAVTQQKTAPAAPKTVVLSQTPAEPRVLPVETNAVAPAAKQNFPVSDFAKQMVASPRTRTDYFYFIILAFICAALAINIFVKIKIQHRHLIMNAIVLIIIINSVLILNQHIVNVNAKIF